MNEYCARKLAPPTSDLPASAVEAVVKAEAVVGDALVGVVAFGSWARGELAQSSDVDLLIIVEDDLEIVRWMYREWDEDPLLWASHRVEPHFVHLPRPDAAMSGLWAEVATDGVVLFERRLAVSSRLVWLRQQIVAGRMSRRQIHGQSYWVEVARDA